MFKRRRIISRSFILSLFLTFRTIQGCEGISRKSRVDGTLKIFLLFIVVVFGLNHVVFAQQSEVITLIKSDSKIASEPLREEMLKVMSENPKADRWCGATDDFVFGIAMTSYTQEDVEKHQLQLKENFVHITAAKEMLVSKVLLDLYAKEGMTDPQLLKTAVLDVAENLMIAAEIVYLDERNFVSEKIVLGLTVAEKQKVVASLISPPAILTVKQSYAQVLHRSARMQMKEKKYENALKQFMEITKIKGFTEINSIALLDIFRCFCALDNKKESENIKQMLCEKKKDTLPLLNVLLDITKNHQNSASLELSKEIEKEIQEISRKILFSEPEFDVENWKFQHEITP